MYLYNTKTKPSILFIQTYKIKHCLPLEYNIKYISKFLFNTKINN